MHHSVPTILVLCLSVLASAAPPQGKPDLLSLINLNLSLPYLPNVTLGIQDDHVHTAFPHEADLPANTFNGFLYKIPHTNLIIKFKNWHHVPNPLTEASNVFHQAATECIHHGGTDGMGHPLYSFVKGNTKLRIEPETYHRPESYIGAMTWGMLMEAIGAFKGWLRAYPGLYFGFAILEIFEPEMREEEDIDKFYVGEGVLANMH